MRIFIGWSKPRSMKLAEALSTWLRLMNPQIMPFVSSMNIAPGEKWRNVLSEALSNADYGIFCLTDENLSQPLEWMSYEKGFLSVSADVNHPDRSIPLVPLIFARSKANIPAEFRDTQSVRFNEENMRFLMRSINRTLATIDEETARSQPYYLSEPGFNASFERYYPILEKNVNQALSQNADENEKQEQSAQGGVQEEFSGEKFARDLETLYRSYGLYPDIGFVYFEGRRAEGILTDKNSTLNKKATVRIQYDNILEEVIRRLEKNESNSSRENRKNALKDLQRAFRAL